MTHFVSERTSSKRRIVQLLRWWSGTFTGEKQSGNEMNLRQLKGVVTCP